MRSKIVHLPSITIQHDFPDVIRDIQNEVCLAEDIWVSCYLMKDEAGATNSVHGKVRVTSSAGDNDPEQITTKALPSLEARDGIDCQWSPSSSDSQLSMLISCPSLSISPTLVSFPSKTWKVTQSMGVDCMDVSGDWIASSSKGGTLRLDRWRNFPSDQDGNQHRIGHGHVSDLTSCQFFPSGEVLLTTSIDMSARIFSIYPDPAKRNSSQPLLLNPRTFSAPHSRAVMAAVIIDRGKEIVTACRDGKLRVWNVAESSVISQGSWPDSDSVEVLAMAITKKRFLNRLGEELPQDKSSHFIALALSSGAVHFVELPDLNPVKLSSCPELAVSSPINAIAFSNPSDIVAFGTRSGTVTLATLDWERSEKEDILSLTILAVWRRNTAAINSLNFAPNTRSLLVAGSDGLPYQVSIGARPVIEEELAGLNCDPVTSIRGLAETQVIFTAGKDNLIRLYHA
ncbi:hypothetical protein O181_049337 [Austropuccinia psidii MF-1]|uniref:WD40 repeat-like protein n=1 Tax=Austropuccinia psidii MF-1 TaxID=1389203 RepID=A0A9Q3HMI4_9BASI|nr:hypothetical protein [Austropuccinia psidii MF-1]